MIDALRPLYRVFKTIILLSYGIIFFGVLLFSFIELKSIIKPMDWVFFGFYLSMGAFLSVVVVDRLWRTWMKNWTELSKKRWKRYGKLYFTSTLLLILLYLNRHTFPSLLLYAGLMVGNLFITAARNAYLYLFEVDLYQLGFRWLAWIFEWQFVFALLEFFTRLFKKKS